MDWDFLGRQSSRPLRQLFKRERQALIRSWLRQSRRQIDRLTDLQRVILRPYFGFKPGSELKLAGCLALFRLSSALLQSLVPVCGPYYLSRLGLWLARIGWRMEGEFSDRLRGLDAARLHRALIEETYSSEVLQAGPPGEGWRRPVRKVEVELALEEFKRRELSGARSEFLGLTYISSTRDYNSGRYYHEELARRFGPETMEQVLTICHAEIFESLLYLPLEEFVRQLELYVNITPELPTQILHAWSKLEPYRVLMPMHSDQLSAELFISHVRIALAILQDRFRAS
ncbi:MAG TPA: hypothetical protein VJ302_05860 [Blastocatellia bacterium]|nr:hypothetical protein [Blastocatellia bacterium]